MNGYNSELMQIYKHVLQVLVPIRKIKRANLSENVNNPAQKYIEIVTRDGFEFWFMGFLRYEKAFNNLEKALSLVSKCQIVEEEGYHSCLSHKISNFH